ncbi:leucine rich repeat containing protein 7 lap1 [Musca autumnalis]|uniref:leucine rich repeat containing protein 7 lap1 n=1 Tax=Musca autumnalis TaxID=221902 RepID=UPI003CED7478
MPLSKCFPCLQFKNEEVVNKLDYSNNVLTDVFPLVWQHERTLEELYLTSTRINNLPPQLFYCQGLKVLHANNNNLETIPEAVGTLRQLQQLNLNRNYISNVPDSIKSCKNLTHLDLSCNTLQRLPDAITSLISLQELLLNETYMEFLPANFGRLVNLRIVELRLNNLVSLPKSMQRLTNLQRLDIGGNEFTKIPDVVFELKQLREFWFDFNQIREIPPMAGKLRELQHFEANGNFITSLPNEISNWHNLEVISISTNDLTTFPFSIGMLKSLVTFKCESNDLTELPDSISNLENLEELVISHNKVKRLPSTIGLLRKLRYLFADDNDLRQLPDEICSCSSLSVLSVSRNKIAELPSNIGHLRQLKVLNIVQNHIATLPVSVFSLVNLTSLWISNNQAQPLVPLQYVDATKKTHLTCFMLPQLGSKQNTRNKDNESDDQLYNSIRRQPNNVVGEVPNNCVSPARRICFAEETTILNTNQNSPTTGTTTGKISEREEMVTVPLPQQQPPPSTSSASTSFAMPSNAYGGTSQLRDGVHFVPAAQTKDFLMRSPTPYPKELRLMAKYLRRNQHKPFEEQYSKEPGNVTDVANIVASSSANQQEFVQFIPSSQSTVTTYVTNYALHHSPRDAGNQIILQTHPSSVQWQQQQQFQQINENSQMPPPLGMGIVPNGSIYYEHNSPNEVYQQYHQPIHHQQQPPLQEYQFYQQQEQQAPMPPSQPQEPIYFHSNMLTHQMGQMTIGTANGNLPDPPPYHIARSFTKKTPEDLTNYEAIRQKQQQQQNHSVENVDEHAHEIYQMVDLSHETDYQNNFKTSHITKQDDENVSTSFNQTQSIMDNSKGATEIASNDSQTAIKENNNITDNSRTASPHLNSAAMLTKSNNKGKTPWLFGVHKNPTVKQISLKWEGDRGFQIDTLPNKEGIFVVSTTPDTDASRLLCLYDKILDVDGCDFTNISVNEARQVLDNTGNVVSIMLSRR